MVTKVHLRTLHATLYGTCSVVKGAWNTIMEDTTTMISLINPPILTTILDTFESITTIADCKLNARAALMNKMVQKEGVKRSYGSELASNAKNLQGDCY